jgi:hypothetical protein
MDHLVYGVPDLEGGIAQLEASTGVRARHGGQHPGRGTHNALLALGGRQYLEIIARDPGQAGATGLLFPDLNGLAEPKLIAWAVAVDSVAAMVERAKAANIETIGPLEGSRRTADGRLLAWKTLRCAPQALAGLPFFIEWQAGTPHPSDQAPTGCRLASFTVGHPHGDAFGRILASLGIAVELQDAVEVNFAARLTTPKGEVGLS